MRVSRTFQDDHLISYSALLCFVFGKGKTFFPTLRNTRGRRKFKIQNILHGKIIRVSWTRELFCMLTIVGFRMWDSWTRFVNVNNMLLLSLTQFKSMKFPNSVVDDSGAVFAAHFHIIWNVFRVVIRLRETQNFIRQQCCWFLSSCTFSMLSCIPNWCELSWKCNNRWV